MGILLGVSGSIHPSNILLVRRLSDVWLDKRAEGRWVLSLTHKHKWGCRNPSFGLATKARGCGSQEERSPGVKRKEAWEQRQRHWKGAGQEEEARESSHTPRSLRKCEGVWGSEHSHSQGNSHLRRGSPGGLPKLQSTSWRVKSQWIVALLVSLESSLNVDV
jgi:hypothetical protein